MKRHLAQASALALLLGAAGCADHGVGTLEPAPDDDGHAHTVSFATDIQPIFDANCLGCHGAGASAGLDLRAATSYTLLVNAASTSYTGARVVPGDPHVSVLYQKLEGDPATGARMPFGGEALPPAQRLLIHDWIEQGAHNN